MIARARPLPRRSRLTLPWTLHEEPPMSTATTIAFNHLAPPDLHDPYPLYERLRLEGPAVFNPIFDLWFVTRHEDVVAVVKDPARFSSADILKPLHPLSPEAVAALGEHSDVYPLLSGDPPMHTRVRNLVGKAFTPQRVAALEPRVRAIATELVAGVAPEGRADLIRRFAYPLPMRLTADMFGMRAADMDDVKRWCDEETLFLMAPLPPERQVECARSVAAYRRYLRDLVEDHRAAPKGDLVDALLDAQHEGEVPLTTEEIVGALCVLIFAGHQTTTNMIGTTLLHLLRRPGAWQTLRDDPGLIPGVVEEALRFDAPVQGMTRTVTEETDLGGVTLPKGAKVFVVFASANRDPACAAEPDTFDVRRAPPAQHLAFGRGPHFCVGASLARLEGRVALEVLTERLPNARLVSDEALEYLPNLVHRGPSALPVAWDVP
ncbi:putative cytochrome P450 hydroxylase [Minicystis rosea]|nr:putative cytochrome P450 hydroxylase [Minicystis rosea]